MNLPPSFALALLFASLPASAQFKARGAAPVAPVLSGPALTGAAVAGLRAPSLSAPVLPSVSLTPTLPAASILPRAVGVGPAAPVKAEADGVASKPVVAALEAAAKPFGDEKGRSSAEAAGHLKASFEGSKLRPADGPAAVVPGVRAWPRAAGVGLARPHNGVSEDKKPETPAPRKSEDEKPMKKWEAVATGLLLAAALAGSLFMWYQLYASMAEVMYNAVPQVQDYPYYGPTGGWEDLFGR